MAGWRTIIITERCKLDFRYGRMNIRKNDELHQIHLSEIGVLLLESTSISITTALLAELIKQKIKVIFCDELHNPQAELIPYYGSYDCSERLKSQISWNRLAMESLWTKIVYEKIQNQMYLLRKLGKEQSNLLLEYLNQIEYYDSSNREGHAAKVYFTALFGRDFSREKDNNPINVALNYGYALLLSIFNREIVANGFTTQLGLFHHNKFNPFNLSCDLMEPFRILVDKIVYHMDLKEFGKNEKMELINLFKIQVRIEGKMYYLPDAIRIYVKSCLDALDAGMIEQINFYQNEL